MNHYVAGQVVQLMGTFTQGAEPVDPSVVSVVIAPFTVTADSTTYVYGAEGSPVVKVSTGVYTVDIDTTDFVAADWAYEWIGTGAGQGVGESIFRLAAPLIPLPV